MALIQSDALTSALLRTERNLGWDRPNLLFAVAGPPSRPTMHYLLQLPGDPTKRLGDLITAGARAAEDVLGLLVVATSQPDMEDALAGFPQRMRSRFAAAWEHVDTSRCVRALVCVLRDGMTVVISREAGESPVLVAEMPAMVGDHEEMTNLVARLLIGETVPLQRTAMMPPRAAIA